VIRRLLTWLWGSPPSPPPPEVDHEQRLEAERRQREGDLRMAVLRAEAAVLLRKLQVRDDGHG
jgi:hypothetical protein